MICTQCAGKTSVVESRKYTGLVMRRRYCKDCGQRSHTLEYPVEYPKVRRAILIAEAQEGRFVEPDPDIIDAYVKEIIKAATIDEEDYGEVGVD